MFKLSLLNSEIKYIANSISHKVPAYTYPQIPDVLAWQADMLSRLQQWSVSTPRLNTVQFTMCEIRYHEIVMLLLRPSPAIPSPTQQNLELCHNSAIVVLESYNQLYRVDNLALSWQILHSVFLATITLLYCIWMVPDVAARTSISTLMQNVKNVSMILSALAEHFVEAKKGRDLLDELSTATIEWLLKRKENTLDQPSTTLPTSISSVMGSYMPREGDQNVSRVATEGVTEDITTGGHLNAEHVWDPFFGLSDETMFPFDMESLMQGVFNDFQTVA